MAAGLSVIPRLPKGCNRCTGIRPLCETLSVTVTLLRWLSIRKSLTPEAWTSEVDGAGGGCFRGMNPLPQNSCEGISVRSQL